MIMSQIFKTKSYKPFIIPMNIVIVLPIILTSVSYYAVFKTIINDYAYLMIFAMNFIFPTIILIVYLIRRKSLKNITGSYIA